jgi:hypothetical protein
MVSRIIWSYILTSGLVATDIADHAVTRFRPILILQTAIFYTSFGFPACPG